MGLCKSHLIPTKPTEIPVIVEIKRASVNQIELLDSIKHKDVIQPLSVLQILNEVRNNNSDSGSDCGSGRMTARKRATMLELHKCRIRLRKMRCELDTERDLVDDMLIDISEGLDRIVL